MRWDSPLNEFAGKGLLFLMLCLTWGFSPPVVDPLFSFQGNIQLEEILRIDSSTSGQQFRTLSSIAYDRSRDEILIADTDAGRVYIFNRRGELSGVLGRGEELRLPSGVAVDIKGVVYVGERESGLIKIFDTEEGRLSGSHRILVAPTREGEEKVAPGKMAIDHDGRLLFVDDVNGWIFVFDKEGEFRYRIGVQGKEKRAFSLLRDIACDTRGLIYTASRGMDPLNVFDGSGKLLYSVSDLRVGVEDVIDPIAIALDGKNRLWVLDGVGRNLRVYDSSGHHLQTIGNEEIQGGLFLPVDIEFDASNNLYILEKGAGRLRIYSVRR